MANLFPEDASFEITDYAQNETDNTSDFKKSYAYNFEKGEFIRGPDGKILLVDKLEAYMNWCNKTLLTKRSRHLSYTKKYGQEYYLLIGMDISKAAIELEVERMTREALRIHPYTKEVINFAFNWEENKEVLVFDYDVITVLDELFTLEGTISLKVS